ncbi:MAG: type II toxin-antitoxin system MqsR family toxin [Thermodesulfovibrionales bacterium]|jgi:motility quorum-sensing regulator/GCU-specific mRNA interferase toxin
MVKRKPHYDLRHLKELLNNQSSRIIRDIAIQNAVSIGYANVDEMLSVINNLCSQHFYKSMTSEQNCKLWQDVYKFIDEDEKLYIKLQLSINGDRAVLIQFKKDTGDE